MKRSNRTRHYYVACLAARTSVFLFLTIYAISKPTLFAEQLAFGPVRFTPLTAVWILLMLSMVFRLFPSSFESLGCQKEFASRFRPTGQESPSIEEVHEADRGARWVLLSWIALNAVFFAGYRCGMLNDAFMVCLAGFYGMCDIICILFFCPFQAWMMHNRCCSTCRIYNWDYFMICTPLLCLNGFFSATACILAAILLLRWEFTYIRRRERFFESSNEALKCRECQEHLCQYKRAMQNTRKRSTPQH